MKFPKLEPHSKFENSNFIMIHTVSISSTQVKNWKFLRYQYEVFRLQVEFTNSHYIQQRGLEPVATVWPPQILKEY